MRNTFSVNQCHPLLMGGVVLFKAFPDITYITKWFKEIVYNNKWFKEIVYNNKTTILMELR